MVDETPSIDDQIARVNAAIADFAEAMRPAIERMTASMGAFAQIAQRAAAITNQNIAAWARLYWRAVPLHVRKRYLPPTPWHMKRARVALRRAGQPVTGDAVTTLATAMRRGTP